MNNETAIENAEKYLNNSIRKSKDSPITKYELRFYNLFKVPLRPFFDINMFRIGKYYFDVVRFDEYCEKRLGYDIDVHGSLSDFVAFKYGNCARNLIEEIMRDA